ncbi:MAG: hypothetical protein LBS51_08120 [Oscillospiraceae bacterium]|nr:hypothetical protein [Oscillospiraceae bacterium]
MPQSEGGYGKPLRNQAGLELAGLYKIKFKKLGRRVVYALERENGKMTVIVIAAREDFDVYISAEKRRIKYGL